ncbi:MAG: Nal1-like putative serine protease, partial [Planctomycetota bacterium]
DVLSAQGGKDAAFERVKEVQAKHTTRLMKIKGVVGTAIGLDQNDRPEVKVLLEKPGVAGIPKKLDDVTVQAVVTGKFYALAPGGKPGKPDKPPKPGKPGNGNKINPKKRFAQPVPIGVSTGNEGECSSGTIGCRVKDTGGNVYALSNNHVYALENNAPIGSRVLQPGRYDAKPRCAVKSGDVIGTLADYEPIDFAGGNNTVDAAIALTSTADVNNATPSNGYGKPKSVPVAAIVGQAVQKYGRTTGLTKGNIYLVNATVDVGYDSGIARFVNQIIITPGSFSGSGDSGSLVVTDPDRSPIGLLFAGSSTHTVANPIGPVLTRFGVTIDGE